MKSSFNPVPYDATVVSDQSLVDLALTVGERNREMVERLTEERERERGERQFVCLYLKCNSDA